MFTLRVCLLVACSALALPLTGCCGNGDPIETIRPFEGEIMGDELASARGFDTSDADRCENACLSYLDEPEADVVTLCEAVGTGEYADKPWDPENTLTTIMCTARFISAGSCR